MLELEVWSVIQCLYDNLAIIELKGVAHINTYYDWYFVGTLTLSKGDNPWMNSLSGFICLWLGACEWLQCAR
jgi:hypothetical protein